MNAKDRQTLQKLIERIRRTYSYCEGHTLLDFEENLMLQEACVFNVLQIGELSKQSLSEEVVSAHPEVPWRQMNGLRNRIVHGYDGVQLNIVWETITENFPELEKQLTAILEENTEQ